jgi:hypothetical protein
MMTTTRLRESLKKGLLSPWYQVSDLEYGYTAYNSLLPSKLFILYSCSNWGKVCGLHFWFGSSSNGSGINRWSKDILSYICFIKIMRGWRCCKLKKFNGSISNSNTALSNSWRWSQRNRSRRVRLQEPHQNLKRSHIVLNFRLSSSSWSTLQLLGLKKRSEYELECLVSRGTHLSISGKYFL